MPQGHAPGPEARRDVVVAMRGRRTSQPPAPGPLIPAADDNAARAVDPVTDLAVTIETLFRARKRTLTDEPTGEAYDIALEAVQLLLNGARAQNRLAEEEHQVLMGMVEEMRNAPQRL